MGLLNRIDSIETYRPNLELIAEGILLEEEKDLEEKLARYEKLESRGAEYLGLALGLAAFSYATGISEFDASTLGMPFITSTVDLKSSVVLNAVLGVGFGLTGTYFGEKVREKMERMGINLE